MLGMGCLRPATVGPAVSTRLLSIAAAQAAGQLGRRLPLAPVRMASVVPASGAEPAVPPVLAAAGKRGRWRTALELLGELEAPGMPPPPAAAYRAVMLACRKRGRTNEALALLERLERLAAEGGARGEPAARALAGAYDEVLLLMRNRGDYAAAARVWARVRGADGGGAPTSLGYGHMLSLCAKDGRWREALALLREMDDQGVTAHDGHTLAAMRACARERRWTEVIGVLRAAPRDAAAAAPVCRAGLRACAEEGEVALASELLGEFLGPAADADDHALVLLAARRARSVHAGREAWAALEASPAAADELCYAQMVGLLFDAAGEGGAAASGAAEEAMGLARAAVGALSATRAAVVLNAALGGAISARLGPQSAELLGLSAGVRESVEAGAQVRVLDLLADWAEWSELRAEAERSLTRRLKLGLASSTDRNAALVTALERVRAAAAAAGDAGDAGARAAGEPLGSLASALRERTANLDADAGRAVIVVDGDGGDSARGEVDAEAERVLSRRYSQTVSIVADAGSSPLDVVYEDDEVVAVTKPTGLPVHPRHRFESRSMVSRVAAHLGGRHPYVLHRLDAPTSGVLLFAKTLVAARALQAEFVARRVTKAYVAVLLGEPPADEFEVDTPVAQHPNDKGLSIVVPGAVPSTGRFGDGPAAPKAALTRFEVFARTDGAAACWARPMTGRMHQIRVHAQSVGCPLAGDAQYGDGGPAGRALSTEPAPSSGRLLLHAHTLDVFHPTRDGRLRLISGLPAEFTAEASALGLGELVADEALRQSSATWLDSSTRSDAAD